MSKPPRISPTDIVKGPADWLDTDFGKLAERMAKVAPTFATIHGPEDVTLKHIVDIASALAITPLLDFDREDK